MNTRDHKTTVVTGKKCAVRDPSDRKQVAQARGKEKGPIDTFLSICSLLPRQATAGPVGRGEGCPINWL